MMVRTLHRFIACILLLTASSMASACNKNADVASTAAGATGSSSEGTGLPTAGTEATGPAAVTSPAESIGWAEEGFRTVFSFIDNRHLLHNYDTGLFIDFGHPSALKYVRGRFDGYHWQAGEMDGGRPVAWTDGVRSVFSFPLDEVTADLELVTRMKATENQRMDLFLNGERIGSTLTNLSTDWNTVRVTLPQALLRVGENLVRFHFARTVNVAGRGRTAGAFDYARIQPPGADPIEAHQLGSFEILDLDGGRALTTPIYGARSVYLMIPEQARLRTYLAVDQLGEPAVEVPAAIRLAVDGQDPQVLWEGTAGSTPQQIEVGLQAYAGQVARLELRASGPVAEGRVQWIDPRLVVPEQPARTLDENLRPRHILVWLVDALRADYFAVYNPETPVEAPNFVGFADQCVTFRRATSQGNTSLPSSGSIMTSTYQDVHGITQPSSELPRDLVVLAQPFREAGWATGLFSANGYVSEGRGFARGSQVYRNLIHEPGRADSEHLWPISVAWINQQAANPWLAFVWTADPHVPYDPPADILSRYYPGSYTGRIRPRATGELLDSLGSGRLEGDDFNYLVALYRGEITYNDLWFGHVLEDLRANQTLDDTLVVIMSDHGEAFFDHGRAGHGTSVFEEQIGVPLMLCHPRSLGEGRSVDVEVENIDVFPTLLDLMGLEIPATVQGGSLVDLLIDPTPVMNRPAFSYHQDFMRGLRMGRWKYILSEDEYLYDLEESPIEGENRLGEHPLVQRFMTDVMSFHLAFATTWKKTAWGFANNHSPAFASQLDASTW